MGEVGKGIKPQNKLDYDSETEKKKFKECTVKKERGEAQARGEWRTQVCH